LHRFCRLKDQYIITTSEFDQVKARLATIENRAASTTRKLDKSKPTLAAHRKQPA